MLLRFKLLSSSIILLIQFQIIKSYHDTQWYHLYSYSEGLYFLVLTFFFFFGFFEGFSLVLVCGLRCPAACGNLSSLTRYWTMSPALEGRFLTPGPPGKSPCPYEFDSFSPKTLLWGKKRIHKWVSCPISAKYKQRGYDQKQASFCPSWQ